MHLEKRVQSSSKILHTNSYAHIMYLVSVSSPNKDTSYVPNTSFPKNGNPHVERQKMAKIDMITLNDLTPSTDKPVKGRLKCTQIRKKKSFSLS